MSETPTTTSSKPVPGWYVDKRWPGEQRRWDGAKWLDEWRPEPVRRGTPGDYILWAFIIAVLGGVLAGVAYAADEGFGMLAIWLVSGLSGLVLSIGIIGKGVEIGVRAARG